MYRNVQNGKYQFNWTHILCYVINKKKLCFDISFVLRIEAVLIYFITISCNHIVPKRLSNDASHFSIFNHRPRAFLTRENRMCHVPFLLDFFPPRVYIDPLRSIGTCGISDCYPQQSIRYEGHNIVYELSSILSVILLNPNMNIFSPCTALDLYWSLNTI